MPDDLKRISGLWLKDGRNGKFMSGEVEDGIPAGSRLLIFKNDKKENDRQPDYTLYAALGDSQSDGGSPRRQSASPPARSQQRPTPPQQQAPPSAAAPRPPLDEDSIPF
jgi:hypothetical protein